MTKNNIFQLEALTYDDVLLIPAYSEIFPRDTNVSTLLTKNIKLNIPFVSASMDTVTEHNLAIAIALKGGIGIIHKNMTIRNQAEQIRQVKRSQSGMIKDPMTLDPQSTVGDAQMIVKKNKIGGIPIIDASNNLMGIVTNRDLRFQKNQSMKLDDIMTKKLIIAKLGINLNEAEKILKKYKIEKLPIVEEGKLVGLITYKDILKNKSMPNACKDNLGRLRVGAAIGVTDDYKERLERLIVSSVDVIVIDTAHAHTKSVIDQIKKDKNPDQPFFAYLHYSKIHHYIKENVFDKHDDFSEEYFSNKDQNLKNYDTYIEEASDYLEKIYQKILNDNLDSNSIIIVISDHGMGVGEKIGERAYGIFTYDYSIRTFAYFI
mgnify:CR=1 FL=1